jgi:hypothetical protein
MTPAYHAKRRKSFGHQALRLSLTALALSYNSNVTTPSLSRHLEVQASPRKQRFVPFPKAGKK